MARVHSRLQCYAMHSTSRIRVFAVNQNKIPTCVRYRGEGGIENVISMLWLIYAFGCNVAVDMDP